ncbi:hypothetical protein L249_1392, partial [Ophiocordyceps polyrhachis-furcata BCC 54312]
ARQEFSQLDVQLHVVDYEDGNHLAFNLQGVDLVISTVSGRAQINLIHAAVRGRVRVFVPSEFEGSISHRPDHHHHDPLDRGSSQALALLRNLARHAQIRYTVFSCGLFMERFHPSGLAYLNIGRGAAIANPGDYLVDINRATAEFADRDARGRSVRVCLSSVYDVVRFLVAAIDLGAERWPVEFTMCGDRMSLNQLVDTCSRVRNGSRRLTAPSPVHFTRHTRSIAELQAYISHFNHAGDAARTAYYQRLLATANGRYDFSHANLNDAILRSNLGEVQPLTLNQWLVIMLQST